MTERERIFDATNAPLLHSKLQPPPLPHDCIRRPQLIERLSAGRYQALTLIAAPAGFGKTTLVNQWLHEPADDAWRLQQEPGRAAWLSLDEQDNAVAPFFAYLIAAIQTAFPAACTAAAAALPVSEGPALRRFTDTLLNNLAALPAPFCLVLDDYHLIDDPAINGELARVVSYLPPGIRCIVTSRTNPPWPLGRLLARGQLLEIRAADLRFSLDEAQALFGAHPAAPADAAITALYERTAGWPAGLQMARRSLHTGAGPLKLAAALHGNERPVMDYLLNEVFAHQSPAVQEFLLVSAVPDRFCAELCDELIKAPAIPCRTLLDQLVRQELFLRPLDDTEQWYCYHQLFRDLLRHKLQVTWPPARIAALQRRAGAWFAARHEFVAALQHTLLAGDAAEAASIVATHFHELADQTCAFRNVARLLERMPATLVAAHPALLVAQAYSALSHGQTAALPALLDQAEHAFGPWATQLAAQEQELLRGDIALLRSAAHFWRGEAHAALQAAEVAAQIVAPQHLHTHALMLRYLAGARYINGDDSAAEQLLATAMSADCDPVSPRLNQLLVTSAVLDLLAGRFTRLNSSAQRLCLPLPDKDERWYAWGDYLRGRIAYEQNDLATAAACFQRVTQSPARVYPQTRHDSLAGLMAIALARGDLAAAALHAAQAQTLAIETRNNVLLAASAALNARLALAEGDPARAQAALAAIDPHICWTTAPWLNIPPLVQAEVLLAQSTPGARPAALDQLTAHVAAAEQVGNRHQALQARLLMVGACDANGQTTAACDQLAAVIGTAACNGLIRSFVDTGRPLIALLQRLATCDQYGGYVHTLLAACTTQWPAQPSTATTAAPPASVASAGELLLTRRERQVLLLLAERLTDSEIAERLIISLPTVKKHASNIYSKLAVGNRREAIVRARALGIL